MIGSGDEAQSFHYFNDQHAGIPLALAPCRIQNQGSPPWPTPLLRSGTGAPELRGGKSVALDICRLPVYEPNALAHLRTKAKGEDGVISPTGGQQALSGCYICYVDGILDDGLPRILFLTQFPNLSHFVPVVYLLAWPWPWHDVSAIHLAFLCVPRCSSWKGAQSSLP